MRKFLKSAGIATAYTSLNFRYAALVVPTGVVAYLMGAPTFMVVTAAALLVLAAATELISSVGNGVSTAQAIAMQEEYAAAGLDALAEYANGGWVGLDGSEGEGSGEEGEAPDEGEAGRPVG